MKKTIHFSKLIVNPENYRFDPVENQQEAIDLMLGEKGSEIVNLAKHILDYGLDEAKDFRVVEIDSGEYRVLDGNRRTVAIKCLHDQSWIKDKKTKKAFQILRKTKKSAPTYIQSFVYDDEKSAAEWIKLDHTGKNDGVGQDSWGTAEQDRFAYKFEGKLSPAMQAVFVVQKELDKKINTKKLKVSTINRIMSNPESRSYLGVDVCGGKLIFTADEKESYARLDKLFDKVIKDNVTVANVYHKPETIRFMSELFGDKPKDAIQPTLPFHENEVEKSNEEGGARKTQREKGEKQKFFGRDLILNKGDTNDFYRDILELHDFYISKSAKLSKKFPAIIRTSLRLLVESAASEMGKLAEYVNCNFTDAKTTLSKDQKTTLANNSIGNAKSLTQLLQSGAHEYTNTANFEQTVAMSVIIGAMLDLTHSKNNEK
ncbi:MAG: hypothetical protein OXN17_02185 [Candidatus Poribacteria bacterium]|nr:hypothetical protein [Candidatus Poribacteria bacterium]